MNVVGYWFSDKLALKASRAQPVEPGALPEVEAMVQDLAHRAEVPVPRLYLIPSEQPNAFATGRNPKHAAVAVTEGLLQYLPADQVKGVLAHEFAHIKNRDILVSSIAAMVAGAISAIANILQFSLSSAAETTRTTAARADRRARDDHPRAARGAAAPARRLTPARVPRRRDRSASSSAGGSARRRARDARARLAGAADERQPGDGVALRGRIRCRGRGVATLFMTHPPLAERVRRLRALDGESAVRLVA